MVLIFESVDEILSVTSEMKSIEQYILVVLFVMLHKIIRSFESADEILSVTSQMKATEQYFPAVLFILLFKVVHSDY